jgi:hypothetical protein
MGLVTVIERQAGLPGGRDYSAASMVQVPHHKAKTLQRQQLLQLIYYFNEIKFGTRPCN